MQLNIDGFNLNYNDVGEGTPVLMLHGWGSSCDAYNFMTKTFSDRFRMVSLDFPGFGKSDMINEPWDVEKYCQITLKFIEKLGITDYIIVGHSFGGRVIIKLAGTYRINPKKIVLIDSAGVLPKRSFKSKVRLASFKTVKAILQLPVIRNYSENTLNKARSYFGSSDYNNAPPVLRQTLVKVVNEDLVPYMGNIKSPTLLIWGENDTATPLRDAKIMEKTIPDAGLCVIKGVGHFSFVERPAQVHAILNSFFGG